MAASKKSAEVVNDLLLDVPRVIQDLLLASRPRAGQPRQPNWCRTLRGHMEDCVLLLGQGLLVGPDPTALQAVTVLLRQVAPEDGHRRPVLFIQSLLEAGLDDKSCFSAAVGLLL